MSVRDPVLERRARIRRLVSIGQRVGYGAMGLAVVIFAIGATRLPELDGRGDRHRVGRVDRGAAAPDRLAYGIRAAEREDRERADDRPGDGT